MKRCRHKRLVMAKAECVDFHPDQEPFTDGVIECAGVSNINVPMIYILYCPVCKVIAIISVDSSDPCDVTACDSDNRCNGH